MSALVPPPCLPAVPRFLAPRLSVLMFLNFAIVGAWQPVFSVYLQGLDFTPAEIAWAYATYSLSTFLTPLIWGQVADRWLPAERCIVLCAGVVAGVLWLLAHTAEPSAVILLSLLYWCFMIPVLSLTTSLTFRQLRRPERDFGKVRVWGTVGWVAAGLLLSGWLTLLKPNLWPAAGTADLADSLRLGAGFAVLLALYGWTLPHTPPLPRAGGPLQARWVRLFDAPLSALRLFRQRAFVVYCVCLFGLYLTMPFNTQLTPLLLRQLGVGPDRLPLALTLSQSTEILTLLCLPWLLTRFGAKQTMTFGIAVWALGMAIYCVGQPVALVLAGLPTHGLFICCFLVAGQVFVNRQADDAFRASAQGFVMLFSGSGLLAGNLLVGWLRQLTADNFQLAYLPAVLAAVGLAVLFVVGFTAQAQSEPAAPESLVPARSVA